MNMSNRKIIEVFMDDNFECYCGNTVILDGFFPCNKDGEYVEPVPGWSGHYKCSCDQVYLNTN